MQTVSARVPPSSTKRSLAMRRNESFSVKVTETIRSPSHSDRSTEAQPPMSLSASTRTRPLE